MLSICGRDLPPEKISLHQKRCSACGGSPPHPPGSKHPADYFSDEEAQSIIMSCKERHWQLFFWILWETGFRVGEALALKKKDLLRDKGELGVWTEKKKPRLYEAVPITADLMTELTNYSQSVRGTNTLFSFEYNSAVAALERARIIAGINRPVRTHMFRHGMVKRIMRAPGLTSAEAMAAAQKIARHKRLQTTMLYGETTEAEAKSTHRRALEGFI
jgi:integrase/recombinase XerD